MRLTDPSPLSFAGLGSLVGRSRASFYRTFSSRADLCDYLHELSVAELRTGVPAMVEAQVDRRDSPRVTAAVLGILTVLRTAPYCSGPVVAHQAIGYAYLLSSQQGSFLSEAAAALVDAIDPGDGAASVPGVKAALRTLLFARLSDLYGMPVAPEARSWPPAAADDPDVQRAVKEILTVLADPASAGAEADEPASAPLTLDATPIPILQGGHHRGRRPAS